MNGQHVPYAVLHDRPPHLLSRGQHGRTAGGTARIVGDQPDRPHPAARVAQHRRRHALRGRDGADDEGGARAGPQRAAAPPVHDAPARAPRRRVQQEAEQQGAGGQRVGRRARRDKRCERQPEHRDTAAEGGQVVQHPRQPPGGLRAQQQRGGDQQGREQRLVRGAGEDE